MSPLDQLQVLNRIDHFDSSIEIIGDFKNGFYEYRYIVAGKREKESSEKYDSIAKAMQAGLNLMIS